MVSFLSLTEQYHISLNITISQINHNITRISQIISPLHKYQKNQKNITRISQYVISLDNITNMSLISQLQYHSFTYHNFDMLYLNKHDNITIYPIRTNMTMHVFLDHVRGFFLNHIEEESKNLVVYATEMV